MNESVQEASSLSAGLGVGLRLLTRHNSVKLHHRMSFRASKPHEQFAEDSLWMSWLASLGCSQEIQYDSVRTPESWYEAEGSLGDGL